MTKGFSLGDFTINQQATDQSAPKGFNLQKVEIEIAGSAFHPFLQRLAHGNPLFSSAFQYNSSPLCFTEESSPWFYATAF